MLRIKIFCCVLLTLTACYRVPNKIEPKVSFAEQEHYVKMLPAAFPPLSYEELQTPWGKEYNIALAFAERYDLYRAVTAFKRAEILMPSSEAQRKKEAAYYTLLCYYLGYRYADVIEEFNQSDLRYVEPSFKTYHDLLVILYESYLNLKDDEFADHTMKLIETHFPATASKLKLSTALSEGNVRVLSAWADKRQSEADVSELLYRYEKEKKSIPAAQYLNMILPGTGYFYVGQIQSGITSMLLNALFIGSAYTFFKHGYTSAAIITTSFELGWYFGGIYGAGEAAKRYNEHIYERFASETLQHRELFPVFMIRYGF